MTPPTFDRSLALICARASAAAYELDDGKRAALLAAADLRELGFLQARSDARLLVAQTAIGEVLWAFQGTQFTAIEIPIILENLKTSPVAVASGGNVMEGYWDQLQALEPFLSEISPPDIITGHSLGGSVANIGANTLTFVLPPLLVTFGAPRCADAAFWATARLLPLRIEHESDPAPRHPLNSDYLQPVGDWWLHDGAVTLCDHRPTIIDMVTSWGDHAINGYIAALQALPGATP